MIITFRWDGFCTTDCDITGTINVEAELKRLQVQYTGIYAKSLYFVLISVKSFV